VLGYAIPDPGFFAPKYAMDIMAVAEKYKDRY
jgi:hypothetical protein